MKSLSIKLQCLISTLDALPVPITLTALADTLKAAHLRAQDLAPFINPNARTYNRATVVTHQHYELLVMTWLPGQASVPHDHNESVCALQVIQGHAIQSNYSIHSDGYADWQYDEVLTSGEITAFHDSGVHTIRNDSLAQETLVTIHVYAPRLGSFRTFIARPNGQLNTLSRQEQPDMPTVVITGGGFSGTMTATHLIKKAKGPIRILLIERNGKVGDGVAYATRDTQHLLNIPAGRMSSRSDAADDFLNWAQQHHGPILPTDFLPRQWYGDYVRSTLQTAINRAGPEVQFSVLYDEVRRIAKHPQDGWMIHFDRSKSLYADAVVLATGHCPPDDPIGSKWHGSRKHYVTDPWKPFATNNIAPDDKVVILGSGLTAVDTVMSLAHNHHTTTITLISRKGLSPQTHAESPIVATDLTDSITRLTEGKTWIKAFDLLKVLRHRINQVTEQGGNWRSVIDGVRPHTALLWQKMALAERKRFISRIRPFWEVHRHRMALTVGEQFYAMIKAGRVRIIAGEVDLVQEEGDGLRVSIRSRKTSEIIDVESKWVVNCTGPTSSNRHGANPAVGSLMVGGKLCRDPLELGVETTSSGNALEANGSEIPSLFVVGTLRKPELWESTAVPELRIQAEVVAQKILKLLNANSTAQ